MEVESCHLSDQSANCGEDIPSHGDVDSAQTAVIEPSEEELEADLSKAKTALLENLATLAESELMPVEPSVDAFTDTVSLASMNLTKGNFATLAESELMPAEPNVDAVTDTKIGAVSLASMNLTKGNFFKGVKWAPDGLCLMACSEDKVIRLINTPNEVLSHKWQEDVNRVTNLKLEPCLTISEAEAIYDYAWWPLMNSNYPETCCFVTTAKDQPIHLWDAFNGELRASYIPKNNVDEVHAAHCVGFSPDGLQMICGFPKELRLFYIDHPGTSCEIWPTKKHKKSSGQRGIISSTEFSPNGEMIACGSYDGTTALYSSKNGELVGIFNSKSKGVTHIKFSPDGYRLYSGSRMSSNIDCWDLRCMSGELFHLERTVETNQRIYFDIASKTCAKRDLVAENLVVSGSTNGAILFWDVSQVCSSDVDVMKSMETATDPIFQFSCHNDCVNGVDIHPYLPVLATSSGQRHYVNPCESDSDSDTELYEAEDNSLKLWHISGMENKLCEVE